MTDRQADGNGQPARGKAATEVAPFPPGPVLLVVLLIGYFVAKAVAGILNKVLERVGFDRAVERDGVKQALARSKYDASDLIAKVVFWLIFLVTLQIAFGLFGPNPVSDLLRGLISYLPNILVAILIIVIAAAIAKAVTDLLSSLLSSMSGGRALANAAGIAILVFGVFAALDQLKIAPRIVTGLWYAVLAILVGSAVVAIGGGGIKTMQGYWERAAAKAEERGPALQRQAQQSGRQARRPGYTDEPAPGTSGTAPIPMDGGTTPPAGSRAHHPAPVTP